MWKDFTSAGCVWVLRQVPVHSPAKDRQLLVLSRRHHATCTRMLYASTYQEPPAGVGAEVEQRTKTCYLCIAYPLHMPFRTSSWHKDEEMQSASSVG